MPESHNGKDEISPTQLRQDQLKRYWEGDVKRRIYLIRRQRKAVLERCRRIAVVGVSDDSNSEGFINTEKLLGLGIEIIPISAQRDSLLGVRCYARVRDIPGALDIVQVYPSEGVNLSEVANDCVEKKVTTFWFESPRAVPDDVEEILGNGRVQLIEFENLVAEYLKHQPMTISASSQARRDKKATKVKDRMTPEPVTVKPDDGLKDAVWKIERGHFRHLPVIDEQAKLIGMLSDRDIRLVQPSRVLVDKNDAQVQLWSLSVQQAAVFDPVSVKPETTLREAAELMLRWHVGGLPVVDSADKLVGIVTYSDVLREYVGQEEH